MSQLNITALVGSLGGIVGAVAAIWVAFTGARRLGLDRQNGALSSISSGINTMKTIIDELQDANDRKNKQIAELEARIDLILQQHEREMEIVKRRMKLLDVRVQELIAENELLKGG